LHTLMTSMLTITIGRQMQCTLIDCQLCVVVWSVVEYHRHFIDFLMAPW
jgi:hypothetical protein